MSNKPATIVPDEEVAAAEEEELELHTDVPTYRIESDIITVEFKPLRFGNQVVSLVQGSLFSSSVMNAIAQACSREAANDLLELRRQIFGQAMVAEDTCPSIHSAFNDDLSLKVEFAAEMTIQLITRVQLKYASFVAITNTALELEEQWNFIFANAPKRRENGPQFGLRRNTEKGGWEPLLSLDMAIDYYYHNNRQLQTIKDLHNQKVKQASATVRGRYAVDI